MSNNNLKGLREVPTQAARSSEKPGSRAVALENPASVVPQKIQDIIGFAQSRLREPKLRACALAITALNETGVELSIVPKPIGAGEVLHLEMPKQMAEGLPQTVAIEPLSGTRCKLSASFQVRPSSKDMRMSVIPRSNDRSDQSDPQDLENTAEVLLVVLQCIGSAVADEIEGILKEAYEIPKMSAGAANVFASMREAAEEGERKDREFKEGIARGLKRRAEEAAKKVLEKGKGEKCEDVTGVHRISSTNSNGPDRLSSRLPEDMIAAAMSALGIKTYEIK